MSSSSEEDQSSATRHRSSKPSGALSDQDQPQHDPDSPYYREVALSDVPSEYAEEVDTFRHILSLPDPRESMPKSSTSVTGLDDEKGRQELRPRGTDSIWTYYNQKYKIKLKVDDYIKNGCKKNETYRRLDCYNRPWQ